METAGDGILVGPVIAMLLIAAVIMISIFFGIMSLIVSAHILLINFRFSKSLDRDQTDQTLLSSKDAENAIAQFEEDWKEIVLQRKE